MNLRPADKLAEALRDLDEAYCRAGSKLTREERTEDRKRLIAARAALAEHDAARASQPEVHVDSPWAKGLGLAVIGRRHFGNPIPQEWYSAARELLAKHSVTCVAQPVAVPDGFEWPKPPPRKGQSPVLFDDGYDEGWAKCIDAIKAMLSTAPRPQQEAPQQDGRPETYEDLFNALQEIDTAACMHPMFVIEREGGIEAFTHNIVALLRKLSATPPTEQRPAEAGKDGGEG